MLPRRAGVVNGTTAPGTSRPRDRDSRTYDITDTREMFIA